MPHLIDIDDALEVGNDQPVPPHITPEEVLGPDGLMAQSLADYQPRESQIRMAGAVALALAESRHLLVEAPTGTGKSFAYLIPTILYAARNQMRAVIATANIALQEQLVEKDLPFLRKLLPVAFKYALIKGRGNFLCADKLLEHKSDLFAGAVTRDDEEEFQSVLAWAKETASGDVSELPFKPSPRTWKHFSVADTGECAGCELPCFHKSAMQEAEEADIVVCNYHLLFADLQVRLKTAGRASVIPEYHILIADEAHEIPDIGANFAGEEVSRWAYRGMKKFLSEGTYQQLDGAAGRFAQALSQARFEDPNKCRITRPGCASYGELVFFLDQAKKELQHDKKREDPEGKRFKQLEHRETQCRQAIAKIKMLVDQEEPEWVYWVDNWQPREGGPAIGKLCGKPVSVAGHLAEFLFPQLHAFIGTSATLTTTRGDFTFVQYRIGLKDAQRLVLPSPFDFTSNALLVIPRDLPEPNDDGFKVVVSAALDKAVLFAGGRSLLLFTAVSAMNAAYDRLRGLFEQAGLTCYRQGDAPPTQLIGHFREDVSSVLFATRTFFQGIDVAGEALSMVTLDRLPFPSPGDPVMDWIAQNDPKGWFYKHSLPMALITFKQIFGRLIRRDTDRGVMLLMDGRVQTKRYGKQFLKAIPGGKLSGELESIQTFLCTDDDPFS